MTSTLSMKILKKEKNKHQNIDARLLNLARQKESVSCLVTKFQQIQMRKEV